MEYQKEFELSELLARKVAGKITEEQQHILDRWLAESPENRAAYGRIMDGETVRQREARSHIFDTGTTIADIGRKVRRRQLRRVSAWAASGAAAMLIGLLTFFYTDVRQPSIDIIHEGHMPLISFNDSEKITLTGTETGMEWEEQLKTVKDSQSAGRQIEENFITVKIEIPRGGNIYRLILADGSVVWLNSGTVIEYPETFASDRRNIRLDGEAFFEVVPDREKPFIVSTIENVAIEVLGTSFNVTAYSGQGNVITTLVEGSVEVSTPYGSSTLTPGHQALVAQGSQAIVVDRADTSSAYSWINGLFDFEGVKLSDICTRLAYWYDVDFEFRDGAGEERFSGRVWMDVPLQEFLDNLSMVTDVAFTEKDGRIIVTPRK